MTSKQIILLLIEIIQDYIAILDSLIPESNTETAKKVTRKNERINKKLKKIKEHLN